jgi:predicted aspartyl protease
LPALSARCCTILRLLACLSLFACLPPFASAVGCKITPGYPASEADMAYFHGKYDQAATLYRQQFQKDPTDPGLTVDLARVLLRQQKLKEATQLVQAAIAIKPNSVPLLTALAQAQYREGTPWLAAATANTASKLDPCYPRLHFVNAQILTLNSNYAAASNELKFAYLLEPSASNYFSSWLNTLPLTQRITEVEAYLAKMDGDSVEKTTSWQAYLSRLKQAAAEPQAACRLVSPINSTSVDFIKIMRDATHMEAFGLPVRFNGHEAHLEIDTGASGLVVSRAVADRAGLKRISSGSLGGIGSEGARAAYTAYADDIKIGALEFRDCKVNVIDKRSALDIDGLIGADVFSSFLVTLDYPVRKLILGRLPPRPGDTTLPSPTLETASSSGDDPSSRVSDSATSAPPERKATSGLHDRYIAPEMKNWTRVYRAGHYLIVPAALNNTSQKLFILDTGAFTTSIAPSAAAEVTKVHSDDFNQIKGISGRVDKVFYAEKINFKFAGLSQDIEDVVSFDTSNLSESVGMDISGLIGFTALAQTTMSIDYRDGLVNFAYDPHRGYSSVPYR